MARQKATRPRREPHVPEPWWGASRSQVQFSADSCPQSGTSVLQLQGTNSANSHVTLREAPKFRRGAQPHWCLHFSPPGARAEGPAKPCQSADHWHCEFINTCCFKPQSLWSLHNIEKQYDTNIIPIQEMAQLRIIVKACSDLMGTDVKWKSWCLNSGMGCLPSKSALFSTVVFHCGHSHHSRFWDLLENYPSLFTCELSTAPTLY